MKISKMSCILFLALFTSICKAADLSDYIGDWQHIKFQEYTVKIEKNGDNGVLIRATKPSPLNGKPETKNVPAVYKDGMLQFARGFGALTIDNSSGYLTNGNAEYKRIKSK